MSKVVKGIFGGGDNGLKQQQREMEAQRLEQERKFKAQQDREAADKLAAEERVRKEQSALAEGRARGRASTILTGGRGLLDDESAKRYLM